MPSCRISSLKSPSCASSIIGSILGNLLLVMGLAVFLGGLKYKEQRFNLKSAGTISSLLVISVIALMIPTVFDLAARAVAPERVATLDVNLSDAAAVVLILATSWRYRAFIPPTNPAPPVATRPSRTRGPRPGRPTAVARPKRRRPWPSVVACLRVERRTAPDGRRRDPAGHRVRRTR